MQPSRLALAAVVSLRAVLVYGEVAGATASELTWREALALPRLRPRAALPAPAPAVSPEAAS
jgi:hypothetical protein